MRFTHDAWMHRLYGANPPAETFAALWERVDAMIWPYAARLLELGVDVVLDYGFWTRASRWSLGWAMAPTVIFVAWWNVAMGVTRGLAQVWALLRRET